MGLFRKRSTDPAELDHLRSEIVAMAARLDAVDADKAQLDHRLHSIVTKIEQAPPPPPPQPPVINQADVDIIRARIQRLYDRLDETAAQSPAPGPAMALDTIASLETRVDQLAADLAAALVDHDDDPSTPPIIDPAAFAALIDRVEAIGNRLDTPSPPPPPPPTPAPEASVPPAVDQVEIDVLRSHLAQLHERVAAIDLRITSISTELANQITELSGDIESLGTRQPAAGAAGGIVDENAVVEVVDELRDAQVKLANEQARYQIAFRQELAELAERLKRA